MRSLVLTVDPAAPPVSGAELRNWQNAQALAALGSVRLLSFRPMHRAPRTIGAIECASLGEGDQASTKKANRRRSSIDLRVGEGQLEALARHIDEFRPGDVIVEGIPLFPLLAFLRPRVAMLRLDMHNIESDLRAELDHRRLGSRLRMALTGGDAASIRTIEWEALALVDQVWVCSETDRRRLRELFGEKAVAVVPNGIPRPESIPATLPESPSREGGWPTILFVGHLGYEPNVTAVTHLAEVLMPMIRNKLPEARLLVAGRSPDETLATLARKRSFDLVVGPQEVQSLYARAHLSIVPLASGGGTRLKILEALAHGVPVIATARAAAGLDLRDGAEIVIADGPDAMLSRVDELCADADRRELLRRNGREAVLMRFGPAAIRAAVAEAVSPITPRASA
jgi:glycosyltransferase involved in cell wall biosynthesis